MLSGSHMQSELWHLAAQLNDFVRGISKDHCSVTSEALGNDLSPYSIFDCINSIQQRRFEQDNEAHSIGQLLHIFTVMTSSLKDDRRNSALCFHFLSNLIVKAGNSNIPKVLLLRGYSRMAARVVELAAGDTSLVTIRFRWSNHNNVLAIIQSRLTSHQVTHWQGHSMAVSSIAKLVLSVFIASIQEKLVDDQGVNPGKDSSAVVFHSIVGPQIEKSRMLDATLLMDIPLSRETYTVLRQKRRRGLIIALFECSLELSTGDDKLTVELSTKSTGYTDSSAEHIMLGKFAQVLVQSHVQVVCCQKRVHPYLVRQLKALNIVCVSRVSVKYMGALARLSGARQLTTMPSIDTESNCAHVIDPSSLGYLHRIEYVHVYGKPFVVTEGYQLVDTTDTNTDTDTDVTSEEPAGGVKSLQKYLLERFSHLSAGFATAFATSVARRQRNCVTVVVTAPTEVTVTLWQKAIEDSLSYLRRLSSERAVVLPGRGIWLAQLAHELRTTHTASIPRTCNSTDAKPTLADQTLENVISDQQISRITRQTLAAERLFIECIEDCAVAAGAARTKRHQLSPDGEGWDDRQLLSQFSLFCRNGVESASRVVLQSPEGDEVAVVREPRGASEDNPNRVQWTYRLDTTGMGATPPLESLSDSLNALQIATDAACALLDVDGIYCVATRAV